MRTSRGPANAACAANGRTAASQLSVPQDAAYLVYWGTYEAARHVNDLGCRFGIAGSITAHVVTAPHVIPEAGGLAVDTLGNLAKGETVWQEGVKDQPLLGNETGGRELSKALGDLLGSQVPTHMVFPGLRQDHTIDFAW